MGIGYASKNKITNYKEYNKYRKENKIFMMKRMMPVVFAESIFDTAGNLVKFNWPRAVLNKVRAVRSGMEASRNTCSL
ncbi:hypothetical protein QTP88_026060 [Uroleucon formosanum]